MNKTNTNAKLTDSQQEFGEARGTTSYPSSCLLTSTLHNLDKYLSATGHAEGHPWRVEIAAALAAATTTLSDDRTEAAERIEEAVSMIGGLLRVAIRASAKQDSASAEVAARAALRYSAEILDYADVLAGGAA